MDMSMRCMVVMNRGDVLHVSLQFHGQGKHRLIGDLPQIQIATTILTAGIRTDNQPEEDGPLLRLIDELVRFLPGQWAVHAEELPALAFSVSTWSMLDISN